MKLILAISVFLILSALALAGPEEISAGPYNISFDLNTTTDYNLTLYPVVEDNDSSLYRLSIGLDDGTMADIGVVENKDWQYGEYPCTFWQGMYLSAAKVSGEIQNGSVSEATIDGREGLVIRQEIFNQSQARTINSTIARYWLDAEEIEGYGLMAAKTEVQMISILPENLTDDLLNTIHVEVS
jgi:hypothetical protein